MQLPLLAVSLLSILLLCTDAHVNKLATPNNSYSHYQTAPMIRLQLAIISNQNFVTEKTQEMYYTQVFVHSSLICNEEDTHYAGPSW